MMSSYRVSPNPRRSPSKTRYQPNDTDRLRLEDLLACGVTLARAAARLGISDDTARYHYRAVVEAAGISARARPAHEPSDRDRAIIRIMAAGGIRQADIAAVFGFSEKTLRAHYRRELDLGATLANARVAQSLFRAATSWLDEGPDAKPTPAAVAAAIFWTKARMGWRGRVGPSPAARRTRLLTCDRAGRPARELPCRACCREGLIEAVRPATDARTGPQARSLRD